MSHHDHGFKADFPHLITRRRALSWFGAAALGGAPSVSMAASCVADAPETAGPFPADGTGRGWGRKPNVLTESGVIRRDIRQSFAGLAGTAPGQALELTLELVAAQSGCAPLAGHAIYIWHCDATGLYSLYDQTDQNFLRGVGVTDDAGHVTFTTIFPGCYPSRWPHIHFEVFASPGDMSSGRDGLLTSQIAFATADCQQVYDSHPAYTNGQSNLARNRFDSDMVFRNDTAAQNRQRTVSLTSGGDALKGQVRIGVPL